MKLLTKLRSSENKIDDIYALLWSLIHRGTKFDIIKSRRVHYKVEGKLDLNGKLYLGFLTNRLALDPLGGGVFRVYSHGTFTMDGLIRIARTCKLFIGGKLTIGAGTYINPGTVIVAMNEVRIGRQCAISWDCSIIDSDYHKISDSTHLQNDNGPISIGDKVWIGSKVTILKNVVIGNGAVIAAGSMVTRNIPSNSLAAGVPARVIKSNIKWT